MRTSLREIIWDFNDGWHYFWSKVSSESWAFTFGMILLPMCLVIAVDIIKIFMMFAWSNDKCL